MLILITQIALFVATPFVERNLSREHQFVLAILRQVFQRRKRALLHRFCTHKQREQLPRVVVKRLNHCQFAQRLHTAILIQIGADVLHLLSR